MSAVKKTKKIKIRAIVHEQSRGFVIVHDGRVTERLPASEVVLEDLHDNTQLITLPEKLAKERGLI